MILTVVPIRCCAWFISAKRNPCDSNPCEHDGVCTPVYGETASCANSYICKCKQGWTGNNCQSE